MNIAVNGRFQLQPQSGVQRYAGEIAGRLINRGLPLRLVAPRFWRAEGAQGHLWEQCALPAQTRGDLLWSPGNTGPVMKEAQVVTVHDLATLDHPEWFQPRFAALYQWALPRLIGRVRRVVCVSEFTRSRLLARWPQAASRLTVIRPGVSTRFARTSPEETARVAGTLGLEPNGYVLCVASFEPRKNHARLLEAWGRIARQFGIPLVLAGQGGREHIFRNGLQAEPELVRNLGRIDDAFLPALYSGARLFVFPSLYEGFGIPPLEAAACGTPVISSGHPALREALGPAAQYCDAMDSASIGEAISAVLSSAALREQLAGRGTERVRLFCWDRAAAETWDVLQRAAA